MFIFVNYFTSCQRENYISDWKYSWYVSFLQLTGLLVIKGQKNIGLFCSGSWKCIGHLKCVTYTGIQYKNKEQLQFIWLKMAWLAINNYSNLWHSQVKHKYIYVCMNICDHKETIENGIIYNKNMRYILKS